LVFPETESPDNPTAQSPVAFGRRLACAYFPCKEKALMFAFTHFVFDSVLTPENAACLLWGVMFALGYRVYRAQQRS
jgi:hypothetical protein